MRPRFSGIAIQQQSIAGYEILRPVPIPERVKLAVRHNHECWDGSGYPDGLAGDQIPLLARIVAVANTYEALTTARRYREAWEPQTAVEEIRRCSRSQFDPCVVKALLSVWRCWVASTDPPGESSNGMVVPKDVQLVAK